MINTETLLSILPSLIGNLQTELQDDNMSLDEVPETLLIERLREEMRRKEFIESAIIEYGEPNGA